MRPKNMRQYAAPLAAVVVAAALVSGCAGASSTPAAAGASHQSGIPTGNASAAHTSPAASATAAPTASAAAPTAELDYVPPVDSAGARVHKTVVGVTYQRLAADLAALKPLPAGDATCNVLNGESATITVTTAGHTKVFVIDGSMCRGVRLTTDGAEQPLLAGSVTLLNQVRAIAGTSGLAHPLGTG